MKANWLIFTIVASIILSLQPDEALGIYPRGEVIDTVACLEHPGQTYCLYIPTGHEDPLPLIVFLEPGARGKLPVNLYRGLAQRYGLILACSNNGRNGPPSLYENALDAMIPDLINRFNPDTTRLVLCGFSGGARYASYYSYRRLNAGVIACGAGASLLGGPEQLELPFYTGIIGRMDMNYLDVTETVLMAAKLGTPTWMLSYDGGHSWPDTLTFQRAFEQVLVQWHTNGLIKIDSLDLEGIRLGMYRYLDSLLIQKRHHEAELTKIRLMAHPLFNPQDSQWLELADKFPGGKDQKKYDRQWKKIQQREELYLDTIFSALEGIQLAQYKQMGQLRPDEWWKIRGKEVLRAMDTDETLFRESAYRMYDFTVQNCQSWGYMHLANAQESEQAIMYFNAWCNFDPGSPEAFYWLAAAYGVAGQDKKALKALETAVEKAEAFKHLHSYEKYQELLSRIKNVKVPGLPE